MFAIMGKTLKVENVQDHAKKASISSKGTVSLDNVPTDISPTLWEDVFGLGDTLALIIITIFRATACQHALQAISHPISGACPAPRTATLVQTADNVSAVAKTTQTSTDNATTTYVQMEQLPLEVNAYLNAQQGQS